MPKTLISSLIALSLFAAGSAANAGNNTLPNDQADLLVSDGATLAPAIGVFMPNASDPDVAINFVLPKDFKKNSVAKVKVHMFVGAAACAIELNPTAVFRFRKGKQLSFAPATGQLVASVPGATPVPGIAGTVFVKEFTLTGLAAGPIIGQKAGDQVTVVFERDLALATDTCGTDVVVTSIRLNYKTP